MDSRVVDRRYAISMSKTRKLARARLWTHSRTAAWRPLRSSILRADAGPKARPRRWPPTKLTSAPASRTRWPSQTGATARTTMVSGLVQPWRLLRRPRPVPLDALNQFEHRRTSADISAS